MKITSGEKEKGKNILETVPNKFVSQDSCLIQKSKIHRKLIIDTFPNKGFEGKIKKRRLYFVKRETEKLC